MHILYTIDLAASISNLQNKFMTKKALFVAYHYPPVAVSSGYQRTLAFTRYLPDFGWQSSVLTVSNKAYDRWEPANEAMIPPHVDVIKAWARDTQRHLSLSGRYLRLMALPDKWQSWILGGLLAGLKAIRKERPQVIISTYPIASAHVLGYLLHRFTGIPWVADFRDPMAQDDYPTDPVVHKSFLWVERKVFKHASRVVFVTESAADCYRERYPETPADKICVLPNGYDEQVFQDIEAQLSAEQASVEQVSEEQAPACSSKLTFVHSGIVYPNERDPRALIMAISQLKQAGVISADNFQLTLRATGHDSYIDELMQQAGIVELVTLAPPVPYQEALKEMLNTDVLLLLQSPGCNAQIPVKAYEYLRTARPVLALTDPEGETGRLISSVPGNTVVELTDVEAIADAIGHIYEQPPASAAEQIKISESVSRFSRTHTAEMLAQLLNKLVRE